MFRRLWEMIWGRRDDRPADKATEEAAHMLEMDEPMAGAGALLSGTHYKSETEEVLERAADSDSSGDGK